METLHPIIFNQVRDLTSIQFTRTHILICIECWGRGGGGRTQEMFWFYQQHDRTFLYITKIELTLRNIDENCFNIKKTKLKFVS